MPRRRKPTTKAIAMVETGLIEAAHQMVKSCGKAMTGFTIIAWDHNGNTAISVHHGMDSGIRPEDLPDAAACSIEQSNELAIDEASRAAIH